MIESFRIKGHLYLADQQITDQQVNGSHRFAISRLYDTYHQFLLIIMNISMFICFSVLYLWYTMTYKYISTSWAMLIFTPTLVLQPWIANAVVIDVFITTPTRPKSVLKAWKYYSHTVSHSVSHSPAPV